MKTGCNAFDTTLKSTPIAFWTEQDVLQYIKENNLPYASVYGEIVQNKKGLLETTGCKRTGCMFCGFGCHLNNDQRFVRMKTTHPKQYEYCMKSVSEGGLGLKDVFDWMNENAGTKIQY